MAPATPTQDYYVTLEVLPSALHSQAKASYRRLARLHHPDKNIGSIHATATTQLINAAWEVLGDVAKRSEYDRSRPQQTASLSGSGPCAPPPATPQSNPQSPLQSETTARDEPRVLSESNRMRREWLNYERSQEEQIRQCRSTVKSLEVDLEYLNTKIDEYRSKLENNTLSAWDMFLSSIKRLSDEEESEIRLASINAENATRIKQILLDKAKVRLKQLNDEFVERKSCEGTRIAAEQAEETRSERLAREKAKESQQRERARHQAERNKAKQESAERFKQEQAKQATETAECEKKEHANLRREKKNATREAAHLARQEELRKKVADEHARVEATREAAHRARQEELRKQVADEHATRQYATAAAQRERARRSNCDHDLRWNEIGASHICPFCTQSLFVFAEQCSRCGIEACRSCAHVLRSAGEPYVHKSYGNGKGGEPSSRWNAGNNTSHG